MINILIYIISLLILGIFICKSKKLSSKARIFLIIYTLWWFLTSFVGFFCFNNLYSFNDLSLLIVLLSIFSFVFAFIYFYKPKEGLQALTKNNKEKKPNKKITIILLILIIILLYYLFRYRNLLDFYGIAESRNIKFTIGMLFNSQIEAYLYNNILYPILMAFIIYLPIEIKSFKYKSINIYLTVLALIIYSLVGNGRLIYFESFFIISMIFLLILDNPFLIIKKNFKFIILICSVLFIMMLVLSASRFGISEFNRIPYLMIHSIEQFLQYIGYPFRAFDKFIEYDCINIINESIPHTLGRATISGLDVLLLKPLNTLGVDIINLNSIFGNLIQNGVSIGYRINMNAYFTNLCNFYVDFGYLGCLLIPGLLGMLIAKGMNIVEQKKNVYLCMIVGSNMAFVCLGTIRWVYTYTPYWILLFLILIIYLYSYISKVGFSKFTTQLIETIKIIIKKSLYSSRMYKIKHPFSNNIFYGGNIINKKNRLKRCIIGYGTYLGSNNSFYEVEFGKYCSIGSNINIAVGKHPTTKFVSTHPAFFSLKKQAGFTYVDNNSFDELSNKRKMKIGNDVWIGDNVIFTKKVIIGDGAIIGAGAVVTKDIPPYAIVGGVPATIIKYRFYEDQIAKLEFINWFEWSNHLIKIRYKDFTDIDIFIKKYFKEVD